MLGCTLVDEHFSLQAVEVMKVAGFVEETEPDAALVLKRDDPGLLWLTLSALKDSMVH